MKWKLLLDAADFRREFTRCCREYDSLVFAAAWSGRADLEIPYAALAPIAKNTRAVIGVELRQTHPDAIRWLLGHGVETRVFNTKKGFFHPKLYLFRSEGQAALFVGSSNLTYNGFKENFEANALVEGEAEKGGEEEGNIRAVEKKLRLWSSDDYSFVPDERWLAKYSDAYEKNYRSSKKNGVKTDPLQENQIKAGGWLVVADWGVYKEKVQQGLAVRERANADENYGNYGTVFREARAKLALPWTTPPLNAVSPGIRENAVISGSISKARA